MLKRERSLLGPSVSLRRSRALQTPRNAGNAIQNTMSSADSRTPAVDEILMCNQLMLILWGVRE